MDSVRITDEEYEHAQRMWRECGCRSLKDYMLVYLNVDVHLLADVFESFRAVTIADDGLDPVNFFSIPGLSWTSVLIILKAEVF